MILGRAVWATLFFSLYATATAHAEGPSTCAEYRTDPGMLATTFLSLKIKGLDDREYTLRFNFACKVSEGEPGERAELADDTGYVQSFAANDNTTAKIDELEVASNFNAHSQTAEPELKLLINNNPEHPDDAIYYRVTFRWNERPRERARYGESLLYFTGQYSAYRKEPGTGDLVLYRGIHNKPVKVARTRSLVRVDRHEMTLSTPEIFKQGLEKAHIGKVAQKFADKISDGATTLDECVVRDSNENEFESSCGGSYEYLNPAHELLSGHFMCTEKIAYVSGLAEVVDQHCEADPLP